MVQKPYLPTLPYDRGPHSFGRLPLRVDVTSSSQPIACLAAICPVPEE